MIGSGISWAICKSAPHSSQITTPAPHQFLIGQMPFLPPNQQRQSTEGNYLHKYYYPNKQKQCHCYGFQFNINQYNITFIHHIDKHS